MRKHLVVASGEMSIFGGGGVVEALGVSVPLEAWVAMTAIGISGLMAVYAREIWGVATGWRTNRLRGLSANIRNELERIERGDQSEMVRAVERQIVATKLERLKIPCPSPQNEATWRIFLARLLIYASEGDLKQARSALADLRERMVAHALKKPQE